MPITCPATSSGVSFFMLATLTPQTFIGGNALAAKAAGGRYSLGFVCTSNNGVTVDKAYYGTIHMTGGSGDFTLEKQ